MRATNRHLELAIQELNELTGNNINAYTRDKDGRYKSNIGSYLLSQAYGGSELHQIVNTGGGVRVVSRGGYDTKKNLLNEIHSIIYGIDLERGNIL